ncbi:PilC/PilY family type IV pilus protein [Acinetobacter baumannii]|uniref:PilC/PilY family type IV pilus protein n=1 Tax=Acinetobacter baumannii TaxID=470 RepID=UPI0003DF8EC6|nr:PilC/PilY family type IV pilus protein [Acinetobacter baumannii]ETQ96922.1 PilC beta-propeller domain protein [Acinetobacter baumannii UH6507]MDC5146568.1 PilC/PilY family type IV pilus protein [Acinetobacter baumannii]MDC5294070.1 PilC/PilY family type IV pilus protein [Acinetobacter baumannii]MDC5422895.1 PilC/PilY family type IV pilus protein [Acinetobacter baumannii]MDC5555835.1 PilC/PilY family type IV pilus protein [Acinetobacter baumannii]
MRNLNQKKPLSMTMSALMTFTTCHSVSVFASDIEIYKSLTSGKTSILLMLDTSGSMGISSLVLPKTNQYGSPGDVEASLCSRVAVSEYYSNRSTANMYEWTYNLKDTRSFSPTYNKTSIYKTVTIGTTTIPYYVRGCTNGTLTEYDRLSRLKDAIIPLLASNDLSDDVIMGLGQFSSKTELTIGTASNRLTDGHSGRILVPNMALTQAQRIKIAQQIAAVKSLDTTTNEDGSANANLKLSSNSYPNVTKSSSGTPTAQAYAEAGAYMMGTGTGSSGTNSGKVSTIYDGYMVKQQADNDGQVYFICVELGTSTTSALGATVKQCVNSWPGYDSTNKTASSGTSIYKPNGNGGWTSVSATTLKNTVGSMSRLWDVYTKLPVGWRFGGWMKVDNEPMDIEPIVGTIWGYGDNIRGLVSYRTNPFSVDGSTDSLIGGFAYSASDTKNGIVYKAGGSTSSCDGNGIYFLTDGAPNSTKDTMAQTIMNTTLTSSYAFSGKPSGTGVLVSPTLKSNLFSGETGGWEYIGEYAKKLFDKTKNPKSMQIKTAVVGFGSSFSGIPKNTDGSYNCDAVKDTNLDAYNACKWGGTDFGNGGFYYAENSADIKNSIINFVKNVTPTFDPVLTGSPTLPQDALNPLRIQPYAYYASFTPKPQESTQLWAGNMNKYHVLNGQLYAANKSTQLFNTDGSLNQSADGIWTGGVKGQLPLGIQLNTDNIQVASRTIYTNREITGSAPYTASEIDSLKKVNLQNVFAIDPSGTALFANDPAKNYWLNLLGYNVTADETVALSDLVNKAELRQVGSVMHSTPVLLTQEGKITTTSGQLNTTDRKDYLLFGTTQGLLHVVDATTGKEIFAFVPNEMMQNQPKAFLSESSSSGGSSNLYYGIDAPWTAHTQYVAKADGTLTVNDSGRTVTDSTSGDEIALKGLQWVYGGLRMGGRSYYALDLSDLTNPKLKFHINPDGAINADKTPNTDNALSYMGQSWSKPTIAYVNFGGKKKLVMFVGGGYDAGYENPAYDQTNNKGAGVYMFDANNGDLLWWSSANASADKGAQAHTENSDLKYSVVSQINAVDRDSDGLVDHLYFGDLGGQAFRIDLNNNATGDNAAAKKGNFVTHVVRLLNQHVNNDGTSPRFYEMPSFSVHHADSGLLGGVALSSGNRSSPLSGVVGTNNPTPSTSASDGVFVIFDKDVANANLYSLADADLKTKDVALASLNAYFTNKFTGDAYKNGVDIATKNGWKYTYSDSAGVYKGMNGLYALDGMLYVNVFYRDGDGIGGSCGAGVKGNSKLYQFCLPTGKCSFYGSSTTQPNNTDLGAGILGTALGNATSNNGQTLLQNVVKKTDNFCTDANKNSPECQLFNTTAKLQNLRWYETR